jgi:hypothetical protein
MVTYDDWATTTNKNIARENETRNDLAHSYIRFKIIEIKNELLALPESHYYGYSTRANPISH